MAYRIDDDENRIQDLKDKIDQLEVQTFSPEVVARNESTRDTGIQTGDSAATNAYPLWMPIRDFGTIGNLTLEILLNRVDGHVAKMTLNGATDFAFSSPPGTDKMMQFVLDVTIDGTGGFTINLPGNLEPGTITIDNTANARTILKIQTTDGAVTYQAQDILATGGAGSQTPWLSDIDAATFDLTNLDRLLFSKTAGSTLAADTTGLTSDATGNLNLNVPSTAMYNWDIFDVLKMRLSETTNVTTLDVTGSLGGQINLSETTTSKVGSIFQGTTTLQYTTTGTTHQFDVGTSKILEINSTGLDINNHFIQFTELTATPTTPSTDDGLIYVKDSGGITTPFFLDSSGTETSMTAGSQTPWLSDIDAEGFDLKDLSNLEFRDVSTGPPGAAIHAIFVQSNSLVVKTASGDNIDFRVGSPNKMVLNATSLTLRDDVDILATNVAKNDIGSNGKEFANLFLENLVLDTSSAVPAGTEYAIFVQSDSLVLNTLSGDDIDFRVAADNKMVLDATSLELNGLFLQFSQISVPADTTVGNSEGNVFLDSTIDPPILKIKKKSSVGAVSVVSLEVGAQTPWQSDINATTFDLTNLDRLLFSKTAGSTLAADTTGLTSDATGNLNLNVPSTAMYNWDIFDVLKMRLSETTNVTTLDVTGSLGGQINLSETTTSKVGSIFQGTTTLQYTTTGTTHQFLVGTASRLELAQNITIICDSGDDILFKEGTTTVGKYDGGTNDWTFNPTGDINLNPGGEVNVFKDLDMQGSSTIDFATSSSAPVGAAAGSIQVKINGISKLIPFFNP